MEAGRGNWPDYREYPVGERGTDVADFSLRLQSSPRAYGAICA